MTWPRCEGFAGSPRIRVSSTCEGTRPVAAPLGLYTAVLIFLPGSPPDGNKLQESQTPGIGLLSVNGSCLRIAWLPRLAELAAINWAFFLDEARSWRLPRRTPCPEASRALLSHAN